MNCIDEDIEVRSEDAIREAVLREDAMREEAEWKMEHEPETMDDDAEEDEEPTLDELPYPEELACCSPAMRELAQGVSEDMAGYLEDRI